MRYRALLFDLDGTLIDSLDDIASALNRVRLHYQLSELPRTEVRAYIGDGVARLIERSFPEVLRNEAQRRYRENYEASLCEQTRLYPGMAELLQRCREAKIALGIVTNKPASWARPILKALRIDEYFDCTLGGEDPVGRKPSAAPLLKALDELSLSGQSQHGLMIGDGHNDLLAAKNAGMPACYVTYGYGERENIEKYRPEFVADSAAQLATIVWPEK